ncbi:MAG: ribulose-phosphate 3-epimerase [Candidatus Hermodarchaeota archaeon]
MTKIAASILSSNFSVLAEEVRKVEEAGVDMLHIDVMDGHFVPNLSIGPMIVKSIRNETTLPFNVHLMVEKPKLFVKPFIDAGADIVTVHVETCSELNHTIKLIKDCGREVGIALNPPTPIESIKNCLDIIHLILIMSVNPGFEGQKFIHSVLPKIVKARQIIDEGGLDIELAVDGGVNIRTVSSVVKAGANVLVMGSAIFGEKDIKSAVKKMRRLINQS